MKLVLSSSPIFKNFKNCPKLARFSKISKIFLNFALIRLKITNFEFLNLFLKAILVHFRKILSLKSRLVL